MRFQPVQLPNGQWTVRDTLTGRMCGQAVRWKALADLRADRLERMYR